MTIMWQSSSSDGARRPFLSILLWVTSLRSEHVDLEQFSKVKFRFTEVAGAERPIGVADTLYHGCDGVIATSVGAALRVATQQRDKRFALSSLQLRFENLF